jgi:transposase-like protein
MTNAKRRKLWRARVADYRASDLPVRKWCESNGVTDNQLRYWLGKIDEASPAPESSGPQSPAWTRVTIVEDASARAFVDQESMLPTQSQVSVRVGSATIDVRSGFDANLLSEVLRVVLVLSKDEGVATC